MRVRNLIVGFVLVLAISGGCRLMKTVSVLAEKRVSEIERISG